MCAGHCEHDRTCLAKFFRNVLGLFNTESEQSDHWSSTDTYNWSRYSFDGKLLILRLLPTLDMSSLLFPFQTHGCKSDLEVVLDVTVRSVLLNRLNRS